MRDEVHLLQVGVLGGPQQVVELLSTLGDLEPVDDGEALVVAHDEDHLVAGQNAGVDVAVHHQVRAVSHPRHDIAVRKRHLGADGATDLVTHAGVAELAIERIGVFCPPTGEEFSGKPACGGQDVVGVVAYLVDSLNDLVVGRRRADRLAALIEVCIPCLLLGLCAAEPVRRCCVIAQGAVDLLDGHARVGHDRRRVLFRRVPAGRVNGHDLEVGVFEQCPGPGSEVLEFGANRDDDVGVFCDRVRTRVTRDSQGSCVVGVGVGEGSLAGEGLHDGDVALCREVAERWSGL